MPYDSLRNIPKDWLEQNTDMLIKAHEKIKNLYWVSWQGGYKWVFGAEKPKPPRSGCEWKRPTIEQTMERQAIFSRVHLTLKPKLNKN